MRRVNVPLQLSIPSHDPFAAVVAESLHSSPDPRISIIIPTLEEEKRIVQSLAQFDPRIREQFGLEVIVSDGGSADRTVECARPFATFVVEHTKSGRQTIALGRNLGAAVARGPILLFLNADVQIPDVEMFFASMLRAFGDPGVVAFTCNVRISPAEETLTDRLFHGFFNWFFHWMNRFGGGMGRGECQAVRTQTFIAAGGYDERMVAGEDFDLFRRLRKMGMVHFDRSITVYESARRFRTSGYLGITALWMLNAGSVMLRGKSYSTEWTPVR